MKTKAEKLLKKIERNLSRGATFHYKSDDAASVNKALDKVCSAVTGSIDEIRAYFDAKPGAQQ